LGEELPQAVGVTGAKRRQRGRAPMEICEANLGSRAKPGIPPAPLSFVVRDAIAWVASSSPKGLGMAVLDRLKILFQVV